MQIAQIQEDHKVLLIAALVRSERVILQALTKWAPEDFDETDKAYQIVWAVSRDYYRAYRRLVPENVMRTEIESRMTADPDWEVATELHSRLDALLQDIYSLAIESDLHVNYVLDILQKMLDERKIRPLIEAIASVPVVEAMAKLHQTYAATRISSAVMFDPSDIDSEEAQKTTAPRIPTGCRAYDLLIEGGFSRPELAVILGPTGGGKTMLGVQIAVESAKSGENVLYFTYEQPVEYRIRNRVWNAASGLDRRLIDGVSPKDMPEDARQQLRSSMAKCKSLRLVDMQVGSEGYGGMDEIEAFIGNAAAQGRQPSLVVIDWIGTMAVRYLSTRGGEIDQSRLGMTILQMMDQCKTISDRHKVNFVVLHQLGAEAGTKSVTAEHNAYSSGDTKRILQKADIGIVVGKADKETHYCKLQKVKGRMGGAMHVWVELDDRHHQVRLTGKEFTSNFDRDGNLSLVAKDALDKVATGRYVMVGDIDTDTGEVISPVVANSRVSDPDDATTDVETVT